MMVIRKAELEDMNKGLLEVFIEGYRDHQNGRPDIFTIQSDEDLEKDYDSLRLEYNDLVDKYNDLQEEIFNIKSNRSHDEYIANKVKEFILNSGN